MADVGNIFFSKGALGLTNAAQAIVLGTFPAAIAGVAADAGAEAVPDAFDAGQVNVLLTNILGGATSITHYLARDAAGLRRITPSVTDTFTASAAGIGRILMHPYRRVGSDIAGQLWLIAFLDVGTANAEVILTGRRG